MDEILCQFGADILDTSGLIKIFEFPSGSACVQAPHKFGRHLFRASPVQGSHFASYSDLHKSAKKSCR